jgi:hypothetical protein
MAYYLALVHKMYLHSENEIWLVLESM